MAPVTEAQAGYYGSAADYLPGWNRSLIRVSWRAPGRDARNLPCLRLFGRQANAVPGAIASERIVPGADRPCRRCDGFHVGVQLMITALR